MTAFKKKIRALFRPQRIVQEYKEQADFWENEAKGLLDKAKTIDLEKAMIRKLCHQQEQELVDLKAQLDTVKEERDAARARISFYMDGIVKGAQDIKAVGVAKLDDTENTYTAVEYTLDPTGKAVKIAEPIGTMHKQAAIDCAKIKFLEIYEDAKH